MPQWHIWFLGLHPANGTQLQLSHHGEWFGPLGPVATLGIQRTALYLCPSALEGAEVGQSTPK